MVYHVALKINSLCSIVMIAKIGDETAARFDDCVRLLVVLHQLHYELDVRDSCDDSSHRFEAERKASQSIEAVCDNLGVMPIIPEDLHKIARHFRLGKELLNGFGFSSRADQ